MLKKFLALLLILPILVLTGCTSSDVGDTSSEDIDFVDVPRSLVEEEDQLASIFFQRAFAQTNEEDIVNESAKLGLYSRMVEGLHGYVQPKVNRILELEEASFGETLQVFSLERSGEVTKKVTEEAFDINYSSDIEAPYDQIYDYKYTIERSDGDIKTVVYTDAARSRVNYLEKFDNGSTGENYSYMQIIHDQSEDQTRVLIHEKVDDNGEGWYTTLFGLERTGGNREFKYIQESNHGGLSAVAVAGVEALNNYNLTGAFYYKTDLEETDLEAGVSESDMETIMKDDTVPSNSDLPFYAQVKGLKSHDSDDLAIDASVTGEETIDKLYDELPGFDTISPKQSQFIIESLTYDSQDSLLERLELVN